MTPLWPLVTAGFLCWTLSCADVRSWRAGWVLAAVALGGTALAWLPLDVSGRDSYFVGAVPLLRATLVLAFIALNLHGFGRQPAAHAVGCVALALFAYAGMELCFAHSDLRLGWAATTASPLWKAFWETVDSYLLDRSYQYLAIIGFAALLALAFGRFATYTGPGDLTAPTSILGGVAPMPWRRVLVRVGGMLVVLAGIGLMLQARVDDPGNRIGLYLGRLLGGSNNSLIEELLFRGLLLPALLLHLPPGPANWLQAGLFSVIHYTYIAEWEAGPILAESGKLLLYYGIGWFFGRAALETRGIGTSAFLHALITGAIWTLLTFRS